MFVFVLVLFDILNKPGAPVPRSPKLEPQGIKKEQMSTMADQDPKITLLRSKLALLIGREDCAVYDTIKAQHPHALEEPWSSDMSGHHKHVGTQSVPDGQDRFPGTN